MSYFKGKFVIGINELYCPGFGWVKAADYNPQLHSMPSTANIKTVDADGSITPYCDMTEREYKSLLVFPAGDNEEE